MSSVATLLESSNLTIADPAPLQDGTRVVYLHAG